MDELICYFNGEYMKESEVKIGIWDLTFMNGGIFDVARTYNHIPHFWEEHIERLVRSCRAAHINLGLTPEEIHNISLEVFKRNEKNLAPEDDFLLVHRITPGAEPMFGVPPPRPTVLINNAYLSPWYKAQARLYQEGIDLVVVNTRQIPPQCLDPKIKHSNRLCNASADFEAKMVDPASVALMLDINGFVSECPRFNVFMVKENKLFTPTTKNCLPGVTRTKILGLANELKIESVEADLCVYDFYNADEILITATSFSIYAVAKFNERELEKPIPGPITKQLLSAFSKKVGIDIVERVLNYVKAKGGVG